QALDEQAPAHQREHERDPRPDVMKRDDDASQWQIQKPVHEGAGFSLAAQEDEEFSPGPGLQDVREANDSEQNNGKDFDRSLHSLLPLTDGQAVSRPLAALLIQE